MAEPMSPERATQLLAETTPETATGPTSDTSGLDDGAGLAGDPDIDIPLGADPEPEPVGDDQAGDDGPAMAGEVLVSPDVFYASFVGAMRVPNMLLRPPLASLELAAGSPDARKVSDAIYGTCMDVHWLRWLLRPEGKWAERALVVGLFSFGLTMAIRTELAERRAAEAPAEPEPMTWPPTPGGDAAGPEPDPSGQHDGILKTSAPG